RFLYEPGDAARKERALAVYEGHGIFDSASGNRRQKSRRLVDLFVVLTLRVKSGISRNVLTVTNVDSQRIIRLEYFHQFPTGLGTRIVQFRNGSLVSTGRALVLRLQPPEFVLTRRRR